MALKRTRAATRKRDRRPTHVLDARLTSADAPELCRRAQRGDARAESMLLTANEPMLRWVVNATVAGEQRFALSTDDARQLARLHALRAIRDFDPELSPSPATCVRLYVTRELRKAARGLGLKGIVRVGWRASQVLAVVQHLTRQGIERPTVAQVREALGARCAGALKISDAHVGQLIDCALAGTPASAELELAERECPRPTPWATLCSKRDAARLGALVIQLPLRAREVLALRYGIGGEARGDMTIAEAAAVLELSVSQVARIERKALAALRALWAQGKKQ